MKKALVKHLKDLAAELPQALETSVTTCYGADLIAQGQNAHSDGTLIQPKAKYRLTGQRLVNHEEKLKDCYKAGGIERVMEYCNKVMPKPIIYDQIQANLKAQKEQE